MLLHPFNYGSLSYYYLLLKNCMCQTWYVCVKCCLGRGGSVIKQIQKESETRINFKDDEEESEDELTEEAKPKIRTMVIRGSRERIKHAEVLIKKVIDEQPVLDKITVEIPQQVVGRIIGKGGKTIRQLCKISGAYIVN